MRHKAREWPDHCLRAGGQSKWLKQEACLIAVDCLC
jgi:hypothetical protein